MALIKDPSPGGPTTDGSTIYTDQHNEIIDTLDLKSPLASPVFTGIVTLPSSATPTTDAVGEIAIDTTITDYFGKLQFHNGSEPEYCVSMPLANLTAVDGNVVAYNAANNEFEMVSAGAGDWTDASTSTGTNKTLDDTTNFIIADGLTIEVKNDSGVTINKGNAVYATNVFDTPASLIEVALADASSSATMPAIGLAKDDISDGATGRIVISGEVDSFDTSSFTEGDELFVSETTGAITAVKPTGTALIQKIGIVLRSNVALGRVQVLGAGRVNDVPNIASANFWLGNGSGVATAVTMSGDATMTNTGVVSVLANTTQVLEVDSSALYPGGGTPAVGLVTKQFGAQNQPIRAIEMSDGENQEVYWQGKLNNWDAGTIKIKAYWYVENDLATPESKTFELDCSGVSLANFDNIGGTAYGTAITITDTTDSSAAEDKINISSASTAITIAGATAAEWLSIKMVRDAATDTAGTVFLAGISIEYTIATGTATV